MTYKHIMIYEEADIHYQSFLIKNKKCYSYIKKNQEKFE